MASHQGQSTSVARGFLFADLRGYSAFVEGYGDRAGAQLLQAYRDLVRSTIASFQGAEVRTEGDSFFIVFDSPSGAVLCGLAILDAAAAVVTESGHRLSVGIGVHAGETVATAEGYVGSAVNIAARICSVARGGELLVSDAVRSITRTYLDVGFVRAGRKRLKGIPEPMTLYRVVPSRAAVPASRKPLERMASRRVWVAALGILILAGTLSLIAVMALTGPDVAVDAPSAGASTVPSPVASATVGPSPSFPNEAETALLDRIDEAITRDCDRPAADEVPVHEYAGTESTYSGPMAVVAGARCSLGSIGEPDVAWFWQPVNSWAADEYFFEVVGELSIPPGDCATDTDAHQAWEFVGDGGDLLCAVGSREAQVVWTYADAGVLGIAIRGDGDVGALYSWWREHARTLGAP